MITTLLVCGPAALAQPDSIALLYPQVREPYQKVFLNIAEGVEKELGRELHHLVVDSNTPTDEIQTWMQENKISGIVALGSPSLYAFADGFNIPMVLGATTIQSDGGPYSGISLNPAPDQLFETIRDLKPSINTIHVVYDTVRNQQEISETIPLAHALQIQLQTYPARDLREAASLYRDIQRSIHSDSDILWLPLGGPSRDKAILQKILETAWVKNQVVISSNLSDVKRGAVFAMYPNNIGMGQDLGKLLMKMIEHPKSTPSVEFAQSLYKAINHRTAEHIDLRLSNQRLNQFDFVYPPR